MHSTTSLSRTITHPLIGDQVSFLQTSEDTGGAYTLVQVTLQPGGGTGLHYHLDFTEEFTAIRGGLGIQLGKKNKVLQPGETAMVPVKVKHRFYNPGTEPITFEVKIAPARYFEQLLRISYGLATDGLCNAKGIPRNIWHLAILFDIGETYLPGMPLGIQRGIFDLLARVARRKGKDKELERYYKETNADAISPRDSGIALSAA